MLNWLAVLVAALVPTVVGSIWYHPKVFGNTWMKVADMTEEKMKGANMALIFGVSFVLSIMLAMAVNPMVIHQMHLSSILIDEPGFGDAASEVGMMMEDFMGKYGDNFRTFKHGLFHGIISGFFIALPILGTNALFERKGFKYIAVNASYWIVTLGLMGGIISAWQ